MNIITEKMSKSGGGDIIHCRPPLQILGGGGVSPVPQGLRLCPPPRVGALISADGRRLSVCPSVPCLTLSREWTGIAS